MINYEVNMCTIYIGNQFHNDPSGRYYTDGDGSGEEFREEVLRPLLECKSIDKITINISRNVEGYGSSFLVEAFGGLIKYGYFKSNFVDNKIELSVDEEDLDDYSFYKDRILEYIRSAKFNSQKYISTKNKAIEEKTFKGIIDKTFVEGFIKNATK
ncbi:STAS-like domain-containing protein [Aeromonas veronii]|uniref:STAS-like domain-containing protein n=2 Tax=Aeromonadaceae TaxID=84642 RepID=UPI0009C0D072|nr:DUF4325 domain-containing protein [Aeromonas veronii]